jgi:hypothetical protein
VLGVAKMLDDAEGAALRAKNLVAVGSGKEATKLAFPESHEPRIGIRSDGSVASERSARWCLRRMSQAKQRDGGTQRLPSSCGRGRCIVAVLPPQRPCLRHFPRALVRVVGLLARIGSARLRLRRAVVRPFARSPRLLRRIPVFKIGEAWQSHAG